MLLFFHRVSNRKYRKNNDSVDDLIFVRGLFGAIALSLTLLYFDFTMQLVTACTMNLETLP